MNCDEIVSGLILEFRRGTLIMVVLAQLNKPMYGYSLVKELEGKGISIEGNTLYPLLRRWDLNPHDCNNHKILSLARLPVPTLPHIFDFLSLVSRDFDIISNQTKYVNT